MIRTMFLAAVVAAVAVSVPAEGAAQDRGSRDRVPDWIPEPPDRDGGWEDRDRRERDRDGGWWERDRRRSDDGDWERRRDRRDDRGARSQRTRARDGGPPFCRSGAGHPVHGRSWCVEKGFGLGRDAWGMRDRGRWERARGWEDIVFGRRRDRWLDRDGLIHVLGGGVLGRLEDRRLHLGLGGRWDGRWLRPAGGGDLLVVRIGGVPVAEFLDRNRDGRVDLVLLGR